MINAIAMFPVLVVDELAPLKAFYESHFGFESEFYQQDFYLHLLQRESNIQLAYMVKSHPSQPEFLHLPASATGMVISLEVSCAKSAFNAARDAALDIILDYKEEEFGVAHFMIRDPAGLVLDIVQHLEQ